jgi:hypothetical protein
VEDPGEEFVIELFAVAEDQRPRGEERSQVAEPDLDIRHRWVGLTGTESVLLADWVRRGRSVGEGMAWNHGMLGLVL